MHNVRKFIKKIRKIVSKSNPFNLVKSSSRDLNIKKSNRELTIEDIERMSDREIMNMINSIESTPIDLLTMEDKENLEYLKNTLNKRLVKRKSEGIEEPISPTPTAPEQEIPANVIKYVEDYLKENTARFSANMPIEPIDDEIMSNYWPYFNQRVLNSFQNEAQAEQFANVVLEQSKKDKVVPEPPDVSEKPVTDFVTTYINTGRPQEIINQIVGRTGYNEIDVSEAIYKAIEDNLKPDRIFKFFIAEPNLLPDRNYEEINKKIDLETIGIDDKEQLKQLAKGKKDIRKDKINEILKDSEYSNDLQEILIGLINKGDEVFDNWAIGNWPIYLQKAKGRDVSLDQIRGTGEEEHSLRDMVEDTDKHLSPPREEFTDEEIADAAQIIDPLTILFGEEYLRKIIDDLRKLKNNVINDMLSGKHNVSPDDMAEKQKKAERLDAYIEANIHNFNNILSGQDIDTRTTGKGRARVFQFNENLGSLGFDRKIIEDMTTQIAKNIDITQADINTLRNEVKNYIENTDIDWLPNWGKLVREEQLREVFANVGEWKKEIKSIQKEEGIQDSSIILDKLGGDFIKEFGGDKTRAQSFINRTLNEDIKEIEESKWDKAIEHKRLDDLVSLKKYIYKLKNRDLEDEEILQNLLRIKELKDSRYAGVMRAIKNSFTNENELKNFIQKTMRQDEEDLYKWKKEKEKEIGEGGAKSAKLQLTQDVPTLLKYLYDYKDKYDSKVFKTFFDIVKPHGRLKKYKPEGRTVNRPDVGLSHTETYYELTREEVPEEVRSVIEKDKKARQNKEKIKEIEDSIKSIIDKKNDIKKQKSEIEKKESKTPEDEKKEQYLENLLNRYQNLINSKKKRQKDIEIKLDIARKERDLTEKYKDIERKIKKNEEKVDKLEEKIRQRRIKALKRDRDLTSKEQKMNEKEQDKIDEILEENKKLKAKKSKVSNISELDLIKLSSTNSLSFILNKYNKFINRVDKLIQIRDKCKNIKTASTGNLLSLINQEINNFEKEIYRFKK